MAFNIQETIGKLQTKQKIMLAIIAVVIVAILWQVKGLLLNDGAATKFKESNAVRPQAEKMLGMNNAENSVETPTAQTVVPMQQTTIRADSTVETLEKENQAKYLDALNDLQLLKIDKDIAQVNQAIVTAKLATMTAEKNIANLQAKPAPLPASAFTGALSAPLIPGQPLVANNQPASSQATENNEKDGFKVVSIVATQSGAPTAMIYHQDRFYNVSKGDPLSPTSYIVKNIDTQKNQVTLSNQDGDIVLKYTSSV